ncbi:mediator of RNA polymerase II transcription subunit 27-like isoform X1 [Varroa destructor]|uniref:Mediator of RNA polymerase II transcription subunit 27 n=1 Tax=Varroa destructor TaxID=109461 RepID=A0A7M7KS30_VARDE|nr:mediator of RNA polymerase II transcription subunit 27-like isoform X1 [Varroa destructor]
MMSIVSFRNLGSSIDHFSVYWRGVSFLDIVCRSLIEQVNLEAVRQALGAVRSVRSLVGKVFRTLAEGVRASHESEERERDQAFKGSLASALSQLHSKLRELESSAQNLGGASLGLGATSFLCQVDPTLDRTSLYVDMVKAHRWLDRVHEYTHHMASILQQNNLKRSNNQVFCNKRRQRLPVPRGHNVPQPPVDQFLSTMQRGLTDMSIDIVRPCGQNAVLKVTLGRTLKAIIVLRGLLIEWVLIKGYTEELYTADDQLDLWTPSRFAVFQKVTEHASAAMLHFHVPSMHEVAVKSFLHWLHSYITLFSDVCRRCNRHLQNHFPPTWHCVRTCEAYHETCRP